MEIRLLHKDVFFTEGLNNIVINFQKKFYKYSYSSHLREHLLKKENRSHMYYKEIFDDCISTIKNNPRDTFEVELSKDINTFNDLKWHVTKYCIRIPYTKEQDVAVVIRPIYDKVTKRYTGLNKVVTAWLNETKDDHITLDSAKYWTSDDWSKGYKSKGE